MFCCCCWRSSSGVVVFPFYGDHVILIVHRLYYCHPRSPEDEAAQQGLTRALAEFCRVCEIFRTESASRICGAFSPLLGWVTCRYLSFSRSSKRRIDLVASFPFLTTANQQASPCPFPALLRIYVITLREPINYRNWMHGLYWLLYSTTA
jgi:hypothetical protein